MGRRRRRQERNQRVGKPEQVSNATPAKTAAAKPKVKRPRPEPPPAPWGKFPLVELSVLLAIGIGIAGAIIWGKRGQIMIVCAVVLGSIAGLEVSIREHFSGYRSHSSLIAGVPAVAVLTVLFFLGAGQIIALGAALIVFGLAFAALRELFRRKSGGRSFR